MSIFLLESHLKFLLSLEVYGRDQWTSGLFCIVISVVRESNLTSERENHGHKSPGNLRLFCLKKGKSKRTETVVVHSKAKGQRPYIFFSQCYPISGCTPSKRRNYCYLLEMLEKSLCSDGLTMALNVFSFAISHHSKVNGRMLYNLKNFISFGFLLNYVLTEDFLLMWQKVYLDLFCYTVLKIHLVLLTIVLPFFF